MPNKYPSIVANKYDPRLIDHHVVCPYCGSKKIRHKDSRSTLLGYFGDTNPNHVWDYYLCGECRKEFSYETKSGEAWYVASDGEVLKGLPNCFESYILKCSYCGGKVVREYRDFDGKSVSCLGFKNGKKDHVEWYVCQDCGQRETLDPTEETQGEIATETVGIVYGLLTSNVTSSEVCVKEGHPEMLLNPDLISADISYIASEARDNGD